MMTQNEIQRLHDLASSRYFTDGTLTQLSELAIRAVQLLIVQSQRIRDLKAVNEAEKRSNEALFNYDNFSRKYSKSKPPKPPEPPPARTINDNAPNILNTLYDIFGVKP